MCHQPFQLVPVFRPKNQYALFQGCESRGGVISDTVASYDPKSDLYQSQEIGMKEAHLG